MQAGKKSTKYKHANCQWSCYYKSMKACKQRAMIVPSNEERKRASEFTERRQRRKHASKQTATAHPTKKAR